MSTKFEVGQKVLVDPNALASYGGNNGREFPSGIGWVTSGPDDEGDYRVSSAENYRPGLSGLYILGEYLSEFSEFPRPITFDEVRAGDRVRLTHDFGSGDSIVRTMTVDRIDDKWLEPANEDMSIGKSITKQYNATFELLARPVPKKVYKAGDVITRDEIKNLPDHTVITTGEADGETVRIFVNGKLYNEQAVNLGGFRPEEMHEDWTFTVRYVSEAGA